MKHGERSVNHHRWQAAGSSRRLAFGAMRRTFVLLAFLSALGALNLPGPAATATGSSTTSTAPGPVPTIVLAQPGAGVVTLTWRLPPAEADAVTAYRVYRDGRLLTEVTDLSAPVFTDAGLTDGERVRHQVSAVTAAGEGPRSEPAVSIVGTRGGDAGAATTASPEGGTERRTYTYSLGTRGAITADTQYFALHVAQTLNDPRGWSLGGAIEFRQVPSGGDFTVYLAEASTVPSFGSPCSSMWSCRVGRAVIINQTRWLQATPSWNAGGGSLDSYRHYVVNHETGHWLGFGHASCPGGGQAAPVMQQQSKGLQGCVHNTWPVSGERSAAGSRHGVGVRDRGVEVQHSTFGRRGDRVLVCDWNGDGVDTPGLVRGNQWRLRNDLRSGGPQVTFRFLEPGGTPVCGDWDGNGTETPGLVRGNQWSLRNLNRGGPATITFRFGSRGDRPVVGDWNGDRIDTPGMVAGNVWRIRNRNSTGTPFATFTFGRPKDRPVAGDWDGNGRTDPGMVRGKPWLLRRTLTSGGPHQRIVFGNRGVPPVVGRWVGLANDLPGRVLHGNWHFRRYAPRP